jgi:hypothetical protein
MKFIVRTIVGKYSNHTIITHTINADIDVLKQSVVAYLEEHGGKDATENFQIVEVDQIDNIQVADKDGYHVYCVSDNPNRLYVFKRLTKVNSGWITQSVNYSWNLIAYYDIISYGGINQTILSDTQIVSDNQTVDKKIVKKNTNHILAPMFGSVIDELKQKKFFLKKK